MHVLVTGSKGFTGKYVCEELGVRGHTVTELTADLLDLQSLNEELKQTQPEAVIHLAGISYADDPNTDLIYRVNLLGTHNLLVGLNSLNIKPECIILASTANVYGNAGLSALNENVALSPENDYAISKLSMELMAKLWMKKLPICIVRPFNYTGLGQAEQFLVPKIVSHFRKKLPEIELGNLEIRREFNDVRDVASIYCDLLDKKPTDQIINLAQGVGFSIRDIIDKCREITGHSLEIKINPTYIRKNEIVSLVGSNELLKRLIPNQKPYTIEETLRWMLNGV